MAEPPSCQNGRSNDGDETASPTDVTLDARDLTALVSGHAVAMLDAAGRVAAWNDDANAVLGYDEAEIVGTSYRAFFPEEARAADRPDALLKRARIEGRAEDEGWRVCSDGNRCWVREVIAPIWTAGGDSDGTDHRIGDAADAVPDADVQGYGWFLHDRTEEHERELERREEAAFLESVFAAQPDILYAFDDDGNYIDWNDRVPEVTGYDDSELTELDPLEFIAPEHRDRIADSIQRILEEDEQVTVEADLLTKDGERIPYEFNSAQITEDEGTVVGFTGVGRDISDRNARERELHEEKALTESIFEAQPDLLYAYDTDRNLIQWNDQLRRITGYDPDDLEGMSPLEFIAPEDREAIGDAVRRILTEGARITAEGRLLTSEGKRLPYEFNSARITDDEGNVLGFTGIGRDVSDRKARERELERLERLNVVVRTVDETMVAAETREEIERAIVDAFADADTYRFAVVGRFDAAATAERRQWEPRTWAGRDADEIDGVIGSYVDPPAAAADRSDASSLEADAVRRYRSLRESEFEPWRRDAREHEYGAVAVVPIVAGGRSFGVLVVAAEEATAFADREREVLQEFGGTIGHAVNAMTVRRLLYRDTAVELEFESTDRGDACIDLGARANCLLAVDHVLPLTDGAYVQYVTVAGIGPDRFRDLAAEQPGIEELRNIDVQGDESRWELTIRDSTFVDLLASYGARLRSKVVDRGRATVTVEASPDAAVRELVDTIRAAYPDTTLVSKRTVEGSVETPGDFRNRVESALTDKQRTALEAAYYGGYFEWPTRNSDATAIADRLGIARQTFHQHLRVAQAKLLEYYFETSL
ncbi:PAS domain S-box protein [Halopiger xanaduensis]|uniref:histidine kinase n=1 Tax=Halopiger xanaduensis (strain DSM 18323 / JCM 14033 / SH-6) TaxID=797210 RepID=F8D3R8_HALXS|nr:PAS domain S-box protein [Halopiger xanaduensis]AEH38571.1 putative PAS/PAC sensor protein [Halopiger xanaduensis SH-6]